MCNKYLGMTAGVRSLAGGLALIPPLLRMSLSVLTMRLVAMMGGERERRVCLNIWGVFSRFITIQR